MNGERDRPKKTWARAEGYKVESRDRASNEKDGEYAIHSLHETHPRPRPPQASPIVNPTTGPLRTSFLNLKSGRRNGQRRGT